MVSTDALTGVFISDQAYFKHDQGVNECHEICYLETYVYWQQSVLVCYKHYRIFRSKSMIMHNHLYSILAIGMATLLICNRLEYLA
jgi:hypothetical protein